MPFSFTVAKCRMVYYNIIMNQPDFSFILPAYNESASIADSIEQCMKLSDNAEYIVINDGSTDNTGDIAAKYPVTLIQFSKNRGKGAALKAGIKKSNGKKLVFVDTDGQDDPRELKKLMKLSRKWDFVIGSRFIGTLHKGSISRLNFWGNRFFTVLINVLFNVYITDSQAGVRVINGEFLRSLNLRAKEYEIETEILIKAVKNGLSIREIPVNRYARAGGVTQFNRIRNGIRILVFILKEWVLNAK